MKAFCYIKDNPNFVPVIPFIMNPKSLKLTQLYGVFDEDTGEWTDGVLAILIRNCAQSETPDRKWIIFDGPVDTIWIENMNTVLDDNKKLCLASGQIIKLKPTMNIMMEVDDLSQASPATISRCGMVLLEPKELGHNVLITSFCNEITAWVDKKITDQLHDIFQYMSNVCVEFTRQNCKFPVPTHPNFHVANTLKVFDSFVRPWKAKAEDEEHDVPKDAETICLNAIVFAFVWGYGGQIHENDREKFDIFLQDLIAGENCIEKYKIMDIDPEMEIKTFKTKLGTEFTSLFDMSFDSTDIKWVNWLKTIPAYEVPGLIKYSEVIVPTVDSIRVNAMVNRMLMNKSHILLCGPTGTGKSISVMNEMTTKFENDNYTYVSLAFSAQTTAQ
jgi:dynein heavy chain